MQYFQHNSVKDPTIIPGKSDMRVWHMISSVATVLLSPNHAAALISVFWSKTGACRSEFLLS